MYLMDKHVIYCKVTMTRAGLFGFLFLTESLSDFSRVIGFWSNISLFTFCVNPKLFEMTTPLLFQMSHPLLWSYDMNEVSTQSPIGKYKGPPKSISLNWGHRYREYNLMSDDIYVVVNMEKF